MHYFPLLLITWNLRCFFSFFPWKTKPKGNTTKQTCLSLCQHQLTSELSLLCCDVEWLIDVVPVRSIHSKRSERDAATSRIRATCFIAWQCIIQQRRNNRDWPEPSVLLARVEMWVPRNIEAGRVIYMQTWWTARKASWVNSRLAAYLGSGPHFVFLASPSDLHNLKVEYYVTDLDKLYIKLKYQERYFQLCTCQFVNVKHISTTFIESVTKTWLETHSQRKRTKWCNVLTINWIKIDIV